MLNMKTRKIFVPGRLCIFGEHSDWASDYINENPSIKEGHALVACIDKGISAEIKKYKGKFIIKEKDGLFNVDLEVSKIKSVIKDNPYYSYVATVVLYMIEN